MWKCHILLALNLGIRRKVWQLYPKRWPTEKTIVIHSTFTSFPAQAHTVRNGGRRSHKEKCSGLKILKMLTLHMVRKSMQHITYLILIMVCIDTFEIVFLYSSRDLNHLQIKKLWRTVDFCTNIKTFEV